MTEEIEQPASLVGDGLDCSVNITAQAQPPALEQPAPEPIGAETRKLEAVLLDEAKKPVTKEDVMSELGVVLKWGEIKVNVGAALIIACFAGDGVGAMQMFSPTVPMSDEDLVKFVKVAEQAVEQCKDTVKKRRPELFPAEGPVIGNLNEFRSKHAIPRSR